jgi:hypothetical protein
LCNAESLTFILILSTDLKFTIFLPKRDEVTEGWRKLHNEELHNLYSSLSIIRSQDLMGMAYSTNGGEEECIQDIYGKASRKEITSKTKM